MSLVRHELTVPAFADARSGVVKQRKCGPRAPGGRTAEPYWRMWCIPQSQLPVLPTDLAGVATVEFGCGSGYVSAWLARRGARPVGVDVSARQLATALRLRGEFGLRSQVRRAPGSAPPAARPRQESNLRHAV